MREYSLDSEKQIELLKAENKRLKRMMSQAYRNEFAYPSFNKDGLGAQGEFIPLQITSILISDLSFEEKVNEVLKVLGAITDVSRIYVFENFDNNTRFKNTFEWCNEGVESQIEKLQDTAYDVCPSWKELLIKDGMIKASDIQTQLPEENREPLAQQDIISILVFPLWVNGKFYGFMGFDECSFQRDWMYFEVQLLKVATRIMSSAFEGWLSEKRSIKNSGLQKLLFEVTKIFTSSGGFANQVSQTLKMLGEYFNVCRVYVFENSEDEEYCSNTLEWCCEGIEKIKEKYIGLSYTKDLPGWKELLTENGFLSTGLLTEQGSEVRSSLNSEGKACSLIAFPIVAGGKFLGFIGFDDCGQTKVWDDSHRHALATISGILAGVIEQQNANKLRRDNHAQILRMNNQLIEKERFLQSLLSAAPVGIMLIKKGVIEYVNDWVLSNSGYSNKELLGHQVSEFYFDDRENKDHIKNFYGVIARDTYAVTEVVMKVKGALKRIYQVVGTKASMFEEEDCYLLIGQDVTHLKKTERNLLESEERYRKILETSVDGIFILKSPQETKFVNSAGITMFGYNVEEFERLELIEVFPNEERLLGFYHSFKAIDKEGYYKGETQIRHRNGDILNLEVYGTSILLNGTRHYYYSLHDITKRMNNERALKQSEKKFRALTENSADHILRIDMKGDLLFCNPAFSRMYGVDGDKMQGRSLAEIAGLPAEFTGEFHVHAEKCGISGKIERRELTIHHKGNELVFDWTITPETNEEGQIVSVLAVGRNFTNRKKEEQELRDAKEKAESADRLKSSFLANMSHEIRTPLNAIVGFSNLLKDNDISVVEKREYVDIINKSSDDLMELINDIIDIAKIESGQMKVSSQSIDVHSLLVQLRGVFEKRVMLEHQDRVKLYLRVPEIPKELTIHADRNRLIQIFNNLLGNALKFTSKGFIEFGYCLEDDRIRFFVRDSGIGIAQENRKIIFDPFRQEEESISKNYGGTGLGLSICKRVIEALGGTLHLISEKGKGSEFYFFLPLTNSEGQVNLGHDVVINSNKDQRV
ncbi:PAS domain S-box protein [Marinilabiliaceae bacterium JC017]|nr:PAS domain S-box protein [Marinilabiliaceae bacterium JC017]